MSEKTPLLYEPPPAYAANQAPPGGYTQPEYSQQPAYAPTQQPPQQPGYQQTGYPQAEGYAPVVQHTKPENSQQPAYGPQQQPPLQPGYQQTGYPQAEGYAPVVQHTQPEYSQHLAYAPQPPHPQPGYQQTGYPQAEGYAPAGQHTVIINQPTTTLEGTFGPTPVDMDCPHCHNHVTSATNKSSVALAWLICGIICFAGIFLPPLWLGCCLIPFCIPSLQDTEHTCPGCKRLVGKHTASAGV